MAHRHIFAACFLFVALSGLASPARAQKISELTEDNIREFIEKTTALAKGASADMSGKETVSYLQAHIHPDARFKTTISYAVPGFKPQKTTMSLGKDDFIDDVHKAEGTVSDYESQVEISDVKISSDGTKAVLKTRTMESGTMPIPDDTGATQNVPMEGASSCTQILMLDDDGVIQMFHANCVTDVQFKTF